jgi:hypothetical protein
VIESVTMTTTSPIASISFDSASATPSGNPMSQGVANIMSAMIGEPFTVVMSATGAVQKVEGFSRIFEKMLKFVPQGPGGPATMNAVKQSFSDEAVLNMMAQGFAQLPSRPVKVGESWNGQITTHNPVIGGLIIKSVSTLKAVDGSPADQVANIALKLTLEQDASAPAAANPMGLSIQIGEGAGEGEIVFDVTRGRLLRSTTRMTMLMTMSGQGPDGAPMNMKSTTKSTTTLELVRQ